MCMCVYVCACACMCTFHCQELIRVSASVDVDAVARNMDFVTLQDNVMNITFCNIESELVSISFALLTSFISLRTLHAVFGLFSVFITLDQSAVLSVNDKHVFSFCFDECFFCGVITVYY